MEYYLSQAAANNVSLKLLESRKKMLKQKHKAAVGGLLPNVAAVGEYQILQDKLTFVEPEWAVGLTASVNVFGGGSDINEIRAAKSEIAAIEAETKNVTNLILTAVKKLYHQCETAKKDYEALEMSKSLAEENLKLYRASFKEGLATSLEVVDAELALSKIKIERAKAVFDYNAAFANLLNVCSISKEPAASNAPAEPEVQNENEFF
jgi:outer membrane protein TolC